MTNDELKKKIVEIIDSSCSFYCGSNVHMDDEQENAIADALIAAGIGDVKEAEHKADVEERALHCLARSFAEAMCKYGDDTHYLVDGFIQDAYSQAEKELAEEGRND